MSAWGFLFYHKKIRLKTSGFSVINSLKFYYITLGTPLQELITFLDYSVKEFKEV
jgi:hypothetical protein